MGEMSRRAFLGTAATTGGLLWTGGWAAAEEAGWPKLPPVTIHVVYVGTGGAWPTPTFDAPAEVAKFKSYLAGVQTRLGDIKFVGGELIPNTVPAAVEAVTKLKDADALLLVHLSFGSGEPLLKLVEAGLPAAIFSQPFSGHDWMYVPRWQKAGKKVILDTMLISTGKIVELTDFHDRGCRTQITTRVSNARAMTRNWCSGLKGDMMTLLHRVVFYGNHVESMRDLAVLMGLKVVEEG